MTARQLAEVCTKITIKLMEGGVPMELAMIGVKSKLDESVVTHKALDEEARYDVVAKELETEFDFCL